VRSRQRCRHGVDTVQSSCARCPWDWQRRGEFTTEVRGVSQAWRLPFCFRYTDSTLHVPIHPRTTVKPLGPVWPFAKGLEPLIGPTESHLALDRWIWSRTTQHWSGNRLSSSAESSSPEHAHRNSNVQHRTSHMMMMMMTDDLLEPPKIFLSPSSSPSEEGRQIPIPIHPINSTHCLPYFFY